MLHQLSAHTVHGGMSDMTGNTIALVIGALTIIVMVMIAIWQQREISRYRKADHAVQEAAAERGRLQSERQARRDFWQPVVDEIRVLLVSLEEIETRILDQGPLDHSTIDADLLGHIQRRLESISDRCPISLHDPLLAVASAIAVLGRTVILTDAEVTGHYYATLTGTPPVRPADRFLASAIGAKAVDQYRAAQNLQDATAAVWKALRVECGVDI
jgi:hypothetical protein